MPIEILPPDDAARRARERLSPKEQRKLDLFFMDAVKSRNTGAVEVALRCGADPNSKAGLSPEEAAGRSRGRAGEWNKRFSFGAFMIDDVAPMNFGSRSDDEQMAEQKQKRQRKLDLFLLDAVKSRNIRAVEAALSYGADPNAKGSDGNSALRKACERGYGEIEDLLRKRGACE
jgi:hypothetical protein